MNPHRRALIELHICVVLWGFTAILGKLITLSALALVWWRMLWSRWRWRVSEGVACAARDPAAPDRDLCGHRVRGRAPLVTFYGSVKLANASVAATCMGLAPAVTALLEPAIAGTRFERHNLLLGILVIPGVALVVGGIPDSMHTGFWVGVIRPCWPRFSSRSTSVSWANAMRSR